MRPNKDHRTEIILYGLLLIPLLFAAAALAQATEQAQGLAEITAVLSEILHTPCFTSAVTSTAHTNIFPRFSARKPNAPKAKALEKAAGAAAATACKPLAVNCVCRMKSAVCWMMNVYC